ncbi:hypothetical protein [Desulfurivibrio dismutans]|uniref:hypothetical protein n=1 Tax=Desulfurivibrio dismutans TaxID=1398908 RepID=UPI0023DACADE|nr:hypothetical protein [Desulfurivibrio alkaliphilus]MDF1615759.1 hypothetical protein [Desulfurivibrio alkaliphilus]
MAESIRCFPAQTRPQLKPVTASPANGTIEWRLPATNKTYKEWEAENLNQDG